MKGTLSMSETLYNTICNKPVSFSSLLTPKGSLTAIIAVRQNKFKPHKHKNNREKKKSHTIGADTYDMQL